MNYILHNIKGLFVAIFGIASIHVVDYIPIISEGLKLIFTAVIGVLTIIYYIRKIKRQ